MKLRDVLRSLCALALCASSSLGDEPVYWDPAVGGNGHYYALISESLPWAAARVRAAQLEVPAGYSLGHMATISNAAENEFISSSFFHPANAFIGFTDELVEGEWRWIDDTPGIWQDPNYFAEPIQTAFTSWGAGEPNNYQGNQDYAHIVWADDPGGHWDDATEFVNNFIAEWEPLSGPRVAGVKVSGLTWVGGGHDIPLGSTDQLMPLPWTRVNQVSVEFSEQVTIAGQAATLVDSGGNEFTMFGPTLAPGSVPGTVQASWQLEEFLPTGRFTLRLDDGILDDDGLSLDGDWIDGESASSGDGAPGGDFVFAFNILAGDANQDGLVSVLDMIEIRNLQGATLGSGEYSLIHDIDSRGTITVADVLLAGVRAFDVLPPTAPASAANVPEPSNIALLGLGLSLVWRAARKRRLR
jgi:hypothetical protein